MQETMTRRDFIKIAGVSAGVLMTNMFHIASAAPNLDIRGLFSTYKLHNGIEFPIFGFGAFSKILGNDNDKNAETVLYSLKLGYKHISVYQTERAVGEAIVQSGILRNEIFISLQLGDVANDDEVIEKFNESLAKLKTTYVDLLIMRFPKSKQMNDDIVQRYVNTWETIEKLYQEGRVKAIGVSNLQLEYFDNFLSQCATKPMVNYVGFNPYHYDERLMELCRNKKIAIATYAPLANGKDLLYEPIITKIAEKYDKSPAQIVMRWNLQKGFATMLGSSDSQMIEENSKIFDFNLDQRDMKAITKVKKSLAPKTRKI